ncbi:MAG: DUF1475 family protein [Sumerlaeia bacterium]
MMKQKTTATKSPLYKLAITVVAGLFLLLLASIIYSSTQANVITELKQINDLIWGKVTLVDLYAGLLLSAMWVVYREQNPLIAFVWTLLFLLTGFLSVLLYVFIQLFKLRNASDTDVFFRGWRAHAQ